MKRLLPVFALASLLGAALAGDAVDTSDWVRLSAGGVFTLRAPPGTVYAPLDGTDSFVAEFDNPQFKIQFDYGPYSNTLSQYRDRPDYTTADIVIDGRKGIVVTGPGKGAWGCDDLVAAAYVVVAHRSGMWGDTRLEISGCTKSRATLATLRAVFESIVFTAR